MHVVEAGVGAVLVDEGLVGALFSDDTIGEDDDAGGHADCGKAVTDNEGCFSSSEFVKLADQLIFGFDIKGTGGLIENHD